MSASLPELEPGESIDTEYEGKVRVIRVDRGEERPLFKFQARNFKPKRYDNQPEWENPKEARLYAAVYVAVGSFREEKSGRRGIPPAVERDGREAVVSYLYCMDGMSPTWIERWYDLSKERQMEYRSRIRGRAADSLIQSPDDD